jgi:hypothetical protein
MVIEDGLPSGIVGGHCCPTRRCIWRSDCGGPLREQ